MTRAKGRHAGRSRRPLPLYRSRKLWAGGAVLVILIGALLWNRREPAASPGAAAPNAGVPVPLSDAPADEGPRRTSVPDPRQIDVTDDPRKGGANAPVRILEFADFQCPSCGQFFLTTQGALNSLYGDKIEWVFLDFPLTQVHDRAMPAAVAAACAHRQGKFWPYHDLLFRNQNRLMDRDLRQYAERAGLDRQAWQACFEKQETLAQVQQDAALADELGVDATPTFFVGGERLKGALPVTSFMEIIDPMLRAGGAAPAPQGTGTSAPQGTGTPPAPQGTGAPPAPQGTGAPPPG
jgi:protein-disulfide isomerase